MDNLAPSGGVDAPLRFACVHCETALTVPRRLAGIRGPCPMCGEIISAPELASSVRKTVPSAVAWATTPAADPPQGSVNGRQTEPGARRMGPAGIPRPVTEALPAGGKPVYRLRCPDRAERLRRIEEQSRRLRRKGRMIAGTLLGAGTAVAVLVSVCADQLTRTPRQRRAEARALRAARNAEARALETAGPRLDPVVAVGKDRTREKAALLVAQQTGLRFLRSRDWIEARSALGPPASGWVTAPAGFLELAGEFTGETTVELIHSRRIPYTERFFSTWKALTKNRRSFTLVIEDTVDGPRLRWDAIEQQIAGGLAAFSRQPDTRSAGQFYVSLSPTGQPSESPGPLIVDVRSPFDGKDACRFEAMIIDEEGRAHHWRQLLEISTPRETFARLAWTRRGDGTPIITVDPVASGPWISPTPTVASTHLFSEPNPTR